MKIIIIAVTVFIAISCWRMPCGYTQEVSVSSNTETSGQNDVESDEQKRMMDILADSEKEYLAGIDSYDLGEKKKARHHFRKSLKKLTSINFDHNLLYGLSDYFERIYQELNNRLNLLATADEPHSAIPSIPIYPDNALVQEYIQIFNRSTTRKSMIRAFERMGMYKDMIERTLKEYRLPQELIYLPIVESRYVIGDVSRAGAVGLWQFMKETAQGYGLRVDFWLDERRDPEKSTKAAAQYLRELYFWFNDWHLALAAYNRGENGIGRDLSFSRTTDFSTLSKHKAIPDETEKYVPQFMACTIIASDPQKYGFDFELEKPNMYDVYETDVMIDLSIAAQCAQTTVEEIRALNPSLIAWCTPKNYPQYPLKIPAGTKAIFIENIAAIADLCPAREFIRYKVKRGDILGKIASYYYTSVKALKQDNNIKNDRLLMPGKILIIKPGRKYLVK